MVSFHSHLDNHQRALIVQNVFHHTFHAQRHRIQIFHHSSIDSYSIFLFDALDKMKGNYKELLMYDNVRTLDDCLREIAKHKPDVVIDDYIQLID